MPILFRCCGCGKEYRVEEKMAGKQATCRCGATTRVPTQGAEGPDESLEDWVAAAFRVRGGGSQAPEPAPPPSAKLEPPSTAKLEPQAPPVPIAVERPKPKRPAQLEPSRWHKLVGVASIVYGGLAALVLLASQVRSPAIGIFEWTAELANVVLAAAIAGGGVLILKRHEHGPACAGLAAIFLCFFSAWGLVLSTLAALCVGAFVIVARNLTLLIVAYSVPVGVAVWCLREEVARQKREAAEQD